MAIDAGIGVGILLTALLWFLVRIQDSFKGKDEQYVEWIRHLLTVMAFTVATVIAKVAYDMYEYESPLSTNITEVLNQLSIVFMIVLIVICFFYFVMLIRYIFRFLTDLYKKRNGETA